MFDTSDDDILQTEEELRLVAVKTYFVVLFFVVMAKPLSYLPCLDPGQTITNISIFTAALTLPAALRTTTYDETGVDYAITGFFGAMSGVGTMYLPTAATVLFGEWGVAACVLLAMILPVLVLVAQYEERDFGYHSAVTEGMISVALTAPQVLTTVAIALMI